MKLRRAVTAAATAATAAVLLASGNAYACSINDFTATVTCDTSTGEPQAAVTVTDKDPSGTPADITVRMRMAVGSDGETVGTGHIAHPTAAGTSTTILVPWLQGYQWNIYVTAGPVHEQLLTNLPISPDTACVATSSKPSGSPGGSGSSAAPSATATTTPSATSTPASPTSTPASPTSTTSPTSSAVAPAPSTSASSSPTAGSGLAETGGGNNAPLIGGAAAVVIAAGAGLLYTVRRRTATARD